MFVFSFVLQCKEWLVFSAASFKSVQQMMVSFSKGAVSKGTKACISLHRWCCSFASWAKMAI
jgi:hypothetical protein